MRGASTARGHSPGAVFASGLERDVGLIVRYDGTDYHGFQKQPNAHTIQGELEQALKGLLGPGQVVGASRTDAGVHAAAQVAVWRGPLPLPLERLPDVLNRRLPASVQILRAGWVPAGWDPRRASSAKQYSYRLWRGLAPPPLAWYRYVHWDSRQLSWARIQESAGLFLGTRNFRAFRTEGSSAETTERTIFASRWVIEEGGQIWRYQVIGSGFLYRMVRHMVGSMMEAAAVDGAAAAIVEGLNDPERKVGALAPASGLILDWIEFRNGEGFDVSRNGIGARG